MKAHRQTADAWGILDGYQDARGRWRPVNERSRAALRKAMAVRAASQLASTETAVMLAYQGQGLRLPEPAELSLEDGTQISVERQLPADLPAGYHQLRRHGSDSVIHLIVAPSRCYLPSRQREWGWALQLYSLRSQKSWGIGDFGDLRRFAEWSGRTSAVNFLLLNPLGAPLPVVPQEASPYFPGSRMYLNPLYLRVEEVPGAGAAGVKLEQLADAGRALNAQRLIDRDAIFPLKMKALEAIFAKFPGDGQFDRFCRERGETLRQFAVFCALAEHHQSGWRKWPARHRQPSAPEVKKFAAQHARRVTFHQWLQWLLDQQFSGAARKLPLLLDVPIGMNPDGFDAWLWQDTLALNVSVGAPPDAFNTQGQDWSVPPFNPHRLRAAAYEPLRHTLRNMLRHAGGLRLDHAMGLFRLYWIPAGAAPADGAYVRYPADELLAVLAIESQRAKAVVVGEDLGTVQPEVRARLQKSGILSYRLMWFEETRPENYPAQALAAITTHDLPTVAGLWSGLDLRNQQRLGLHPNVAGTTAIRKRLRAGARLDNSAPTRAAILGAYRLLARAPCRLRAAMLEDALAVEERPNMPGTTTQWPNWRIALPKTLEEIERDSLVSELASSMEAAGKKGRQRR